jgi:Fic family protein
MRWNWQQPNWPYFTYNKNLLDSLETAFLHKNSFLSGCYYHLTHENKDELRVEILSTEASKTSEIEGEHLNRDSLRSSIARHLGLKTEHRKVSLAEQGITEMTMNVYESSQLALASDILCEWHLLLMNGRRDLERVGSYRTHEEPMQIISNPHYKTKIHFEAPPSKQVSNEMDRFIKWFNASAPHYPDALPALTRAALTHLYFVSIHPFEDGNGRIGRALVEKSLAQSLGHPTLIALSTVIEKNKKKYYAALEQANKSNEVSEWLMYFANTILEAQDYTQKLIQFLIEKNKLYQRIKGKLNARQEKVIARVFQEGLEGFKGGLSAENYIRITDTSRATATRDLHELVENAVLIKIGKRKSTRYLLNI